ncbi:MAG: hypothetical protein M9908_04290 [Phyllobacteriaceae bacterium]|nr:hypothetical protein [Phyllobacteriaceae bacterium]
MSPLFAICAIKQHLVPACRPAQRRLPQVKNRTKTRKNGHFADKAGYPKSESQAGKVKFKRAIRFAAHPASRLKK